AAAVDHRLLHHHAVPLEELRFHRRVELDEATGYRAGSDLDGGEGLAGLRQIGVGGAVRAARGARAGWGPGRRADAGHAALARPTGRAGEGQAERQENANSGHDSSPSARAGPGLLDQGAPAGARGVPRGVERVLLVLAPR